MATIPPCPETPPGSSSFFYRFCELAEKGWAREVSHDASYNGETFIKHHGFSGVRWKPIGYYPPSRNASGMKSSIYCHFCKMTKKAWDPAPICNSLVMGGEGGGGPKMMHLCV